MLPLFEDQTKGWLATRGLPVPTGYAAKTLDEVKTLAVSMKQGCVVKALVPTGRRGKSGGVVLATDPDEAAAAAMRMIGSTIGNHTVSQVYVEEDVQIARELYLSLSISGELVELLVSQEGGVEIDQSFAFSPETIVRSKLNILSGITRWQCVDLWRTAGIQGDLLRELGALTVQLFEAFRAADAVTLEINPLAVTADGRLVLAGAMMAVDDYALFRQPQWKTRAAFDEGSHTNEREQRVRAVNSQVGGGEAQYVELAGDIGLLVGGGGAGLYIHDLIVSMGGEPANHCVTPPTGNNTVKLKAVISAILDNPRTRSLLIGFNFAQMARADIRIEALVEVLRGQAAGAPRVPIIVRLFGPGEEKARALAAEFSNITYLPRGTSLRDACRVAIEKTRAPA